MTSSGKLASAVAPIDNVEIVGRQGKPFPPANVHINGELAFGVADVAGPMTVTWAHRDRLLLADTVIGHEEGNVGPEAGTTYNLRVLDEADTVLEEQTGITGTEWFHSGAELAGDIKIELESERDTFPSFQKYVFQVAREAWLAESQALFARLTTPIVDDHKHAIDTFIYKMKLAGLWAKTTVLKPYFAGIDAQAQSQNWVQNAYHDVDVGVVTHASLSHIAGNGTNSYTKNGYAPGLSDLIVTQNSASIMTWILNNVSAASVDFGNSRTYINNRGTTDIIGARIASTASANVSVATSAGITVASRLNATTIDLYRDGVSLGSPAVASTSPVNLEMYTGARNNAGVADQFSARQIAATGVFSGLTSADDAALVPLLQELKTAIDAL